MEVSLVGNAEITSKGQVTIPQEVRSRLNVADGDRLAFICEGDYAIVMNANVYALKTLQRAMEGEAEKAGLTAEEDIIALCREVRSEMENR